MSDEDRRRMRTNIEQRGRAALRFGVLSRFNAGEHLSHVRGHFQEACHVHRAEPVDCAARLWRYGWQQFGIIAGDGPVQRSQKHGKVPAGRISDRADVIGVDAVLDGMGPDPAHRQL